MDHTGQPVSWAERAVAGTLPPGAPLRSSVPFADLLDVAEAMLEAYPRDIFTAGGPRVGAETRFVVELRRAIDECRAIAASKSDIDERRAHRVGYAVHPANRGLSHYGDQWCEAPVSDRTAICRVQPD